MGEALEWGCRLGENGGGNKPFAILAEDGLLRAETWPFRRRKAMFCGMRCVRRVLDLRWRRFRKAVTSRVFRYAEGIGKVGIIYTKV